MAAGIEIRDRIKELRRVKARDLLPNPKNWRRHPIEQIKALRDLLGEIGFAGALLARETSEGLMLIDGHLRTDTVRENQELPVLITDLNEEEADKLLLTYDPLSAMAQADGEAVKALLATFHTDSQAIGALLERIAGQEAWQAVNQHPDIWDPQPETDRADELKAKWGTQRGQRWDIGPHRLFIGDCRAEADVAALWADNGRKARMIWTDPPYGVDYAGKNAYLNRSDKGNRIQKPIENDRLSAEESQRLFSTALYQAGACTMPGAVCYATVPSGPLLARFIAGFCEGGFDFRHLLVWVKQQFVIGLSDYHYRHEAILYGWKTDEGHYFADDRTQDSVFEVNKPQVSELHPTMKPVELIAKMVANSSRRGEIVYDPFCGSGSTLVAAAELDRVGYGVELDPGYGAVTLERLSMLGLKADLSDSKIACQTENAESL